jgi:glyceraldehyde-3-phosphate dehydrogenase (NADP+)
MTLDKKITTTVPVYNSYTGEIIGNVPQSTEQDVLHALDMAKKGEQIGID